MYNHYEVIEIACARHEVITIYGTDEGYIIHGTDRKRTRTKEGRGDSIFKAFETLVGTGAVDISS